MTDLIAILVLGVCPSCPHMTSLSDDINVDDEETLIIT
jgi:hypothetical protein